MRYLSLAEALIIGEVVTGIDARTLSRASRLDLLDSTLHAPQAGFGDDDFYPDFTTKAAVLVVRLARNHPLTDGNKRLAWQSLTSPFASKERSGSWLHGFSPTNVRVKSVARGRFLWGGC